MEVSTGRVVNALDRGGTCDTLWRILRRRRTDEIAAGSVSERRLRDSNPGGALKPQPH